MLLVLINMVFDWFVRKSYKGKIWRGSFGIKGLNVVFLVYSRLEREYVN